MDNVRTTVLIVDDEPNNIAVLAGILGPAHEILAATNGAKALELAQRHLPDLVLLDISMPDMDGYEVCRQLKNSFATSAIPVLFVTALDTEEFELEGLELGAMDYVTKPLKSALVRQRVLNCLAFKLQRDELERKVNELEALNSQLLHEKEQVKVLSGLIPICCVCKKIRDDEGYWNKLETYISQHSEALFTHSYCPQCGENMLNDFKKNRLQRQEATDSEG